MTPAELEQIAKIQKADGSPVDPKAFYFVLRIDQHGDDKVWIDCCREAVEHLAEALATREYLPELVVDLMGYLMATQRPDSPPLKCESSEVEAQAAAAPVEQESGEEVIVVDGREAAIRQILPCGNYDHPHLRKWYIVDIHNGSYYLRHDGQWRDGIDCESGDGVWPTEQSARDFARQQGR